MASLTFPNILTAGTTAIASQVMANFLAVSSVINGSIDQNNFTPFTGPVSWIITSSVLAQSISSSGAAGVVSINSTGVQNASTSIFRLTSNIGQTTGDAAIYADFTSAASSIPVLKLATAGIGSNVDLTASASGNTAPVLLIKNASAGPMVSYRDNSGNKLFEIDATGAQTISPEPLSGNVLLNGGFDWWQRGTTTAVANAVSSYVADQWYVKNSLGTTGVVTGAQVTGVTAGSLFGLSVKVSTAPTAAQANGCEVYQVLENFDSLGVYGRTCSFSAQLKGLGNVTQVGLQFFYATTETKLTTAIGSEILVTVGTSSFTLGKILAQALGTAQTSAGVVGVRIRIATVSSGNTYDLNNGFVVEQAMMNTGNQPGNFLRRYRSAQAELQHCQRFYEKSYDTTTVPGTATANGAAFAFTVRASATAADAPIFFKTTKRAVPAMSSYNGSTGAVGTWHDSGAVDQSVAFANTGYSYSLAFATISSGGTVSGHWTAEAGI